MRTISNHDMRSNINIEVLYQTQHDRLKRFIAKKVWNEEDVQDILQMTFLEAVRCKDRYAGDSKPETWLFGIAVNLMRNYFKRHYGQVQLDEITDEILATLESDTEMDPSILLEHESILDKTMAAMEEMPADVQAIFHLIIDGENSYQETADYIGVPVGTIRSRLSRARKNLKSYLGI